MSQDFPDFDYAPGGDDVRTALLNLRTRTISMETSFSGTSFPTAKEGKLVYREDEQTFYGCTDDTAPVWSKFNVGITPIALGGSGSTTAAGARTAFGLGAAAVLGVADNTAGAAGVATTSLLTPASGAAAIAALGMKVRVTGADTTPTELFSKFVAGAGITLAVQNPGANENILITASGSETGDLCFTMRTSKTGWVYANGLTIGNAGSGATNRANADTSDLYTLIWTNVPNTLAPIQDSTGALTSRGASAALDFAAGKRLPLPDTRGRSLVGRDDMGASAANRITTGGAGFNGTLLGAYGGAETHSLITAEGPSHTHDATGLSTNSTGAHTHTVPTGSTDNGSYLRTGTVLDGGPGTVTSSSSGAHSHTISGSLGTSGSGNPHNNTQPSYIANIFIKL